MYMIIFIVHFLRICYNNNFKGHYYDNYVVIILLTTSLIVTILSLLVPRYILVISCLFFCIPECMEKVYSKGNDTPILKLYTHPN